jgi:tetratricopeptide (TPR) repeat protein
MTAADAMRMATQYFQSGQILPAEQLFRYALSLEPRNAAALHALGQIAYLKGNLHDSMALLRQAADVQPANADYWNDFGVACCKAEAFDDGIAACEEALRLRPDFAQAYSNLGYALLYKGNHPRAVTVLEEAVRLRPDLADAYGNLGVALKCLDRPAEAATALEEAFRLNPTNADAANMAGMVLQRDGNLDRAIEFYRHALRVNPHYADAMNNLATCFKEQGQLKDAVAHFRATLRIQPDHTMAYYNLSELAADGRYEFPPQDIANLRNLLAHEHASPLMRSVAGFALGAVLDAQGAYDEAFPVFAQANELRLQYLRATNRSFDPARHRAFVDDIIATFDRAYFERVQDWGTDTDLPVFVLGMPRSGTTLVEQILASHPAVFGAGELGEFPRIMSQVTGTPATEGLARAVPFPNAAVARDVGGRYLRTLSQLGEGASRVTIKLPENLVYLGLLATLFPRARVVYIRRDPRDVCLSCYFHNFQFMEYSFSLEHTAFYYREYERLMAHWAEVLPLPIHEVCYEDLLANQDRVSRGLVHFCGLDWDERCLSFHKTRRVVQTASTIQVRKPLSKKPAGRWRNYISYLQPLLEALGDADTISHEPLANADASPILARSVGEVGPC